MQRTTKFKSWSALSPFVFAALLVLGATGFTALLHPRVSFVPSAFFVVAVILASWRGNILVGTITGLVAATVRQAMYLRHARELWTAEDLANILIFTAMSAALAALMHTLRLEQRKLRDTAEQLRLIFASVKDYAIFTVDARGTITSWNEGCKHVFGYNADEFISRDFADLFSAEDRTAGAAHQELRDATEHGAGQDERWMLRKNGDRFWAFGVMYPLRDDRRGIVGFCKIVRDLTDRKKAQMGLAEAHRELEQRVSDRTGDLQKSRDDLEQLLYTIAHDLRAPNRAMTGFVQVLESEYREQLDAKAREFLARISNAAQRNDALIRDVLALGRLMHAPFPDALVDARAVLNAVLAEMEDEIRAREAQITIHGDWLPVLGHETLLHQALSNLLANAIQHVAPGRKPVVSVTALPINDSLRIEIEDNGLGISAELHDQIFQPFLRVDPAASSGTGMGLAIVRKAVERMNGRLGLHSAPDQGSRFWLELRTPSQTPDVAPSA